MRPLLSAPGQQTVISRRRETNEVSLKITPSRRWMICCTEEIEIELGEVEVTGTYRTEYQRGGSYVQVELQKFVWVLPSVFA